jgi:hypothetical protein
MLPADQLEVLPLKKRRNLLDLRKLVCDPTALPPDPGPELAAKIQRLAERIVAARARGASVMLTYGAHLVKNGAAPLVNALVEQGWVSHVATQGAGVIHDWEFAFQGFSGESVREGTAVGRFGSWDETGRWISLAVLAGAAEGMGFGEAVGRLIVEGGIRLPSPVELGQQIAAAPADPLAGAKADLLWTMEHFGLSAGWHPLEHPFKSYSILARAYQHRVPMTVHPGIGYDIIVNHPFYHGGAVGRAAATDARVFAQSVDGLSDGVYLSIGSAIMSPQVFEKALSAANNLRARRGQPFVQGHYLAIVDLQDGGGWDWSQGEPPSDHPAYYLRFCKSFYRMGGTLEYCCCDNRLLLANLLARLSHVSA